ncbi:multifunctional 2',3'-cyclic-nucleotide 2'-phosphodiesterase/5'-nucleotidase/3'-nucleotidase [Fibrobacter sp. UWB4]|uniref:bifunctional metallophosphatase/5'-nucleotidase n=1 Tax=Fibrobacter sp. UWB4 TaxID=1964356 RepID=UPI000B520266|nr:5'-nucleotidase C-terminal domain-containing protein [Fibrobacter sp. UWB4]OWV20512.1 multifunctional 2',3'-cyclic-nucleotide 2'-phosphodiesterase/5'-nucleotidase/3'-nucleotidase [Fibrobacter sp. UWB4]
MNKLKYLLPLVVFGVFSCSGKQPQVSGDKQVLASPRSIVVVYENDVHCNMEGYAKFAGLRDAIADTADVVTVSSGDFLQGGAMGSISRGGYVVSMMNAVGYDVVTLGNHEFDYKIPRLMELSDSMNAAIVCANLVQKGTLTPLFKPYVLKQIGAKKIAFVGVLTPQTLVGEAYAFTDESLKTLYDIPAKDIFNLVQLAVDDARKAGADYVILLSHLGFVPPVSSVEVVQKTTGIDAVLDGHSHSIVGEKFVLNSDGDSVLVSQTGTKFQNVGMLDIYPDGKSHSRLISMDSVVAVNRKVAAVHDSLLALTAADLQKVVSNTKFDLTINGDDGKRLVRKGETNLGDLAADAMRFSVGAQIGIENGGSVRVTIPAGAVKYQDILNVMPFANGMCLIRATGRQIKEALAQGASKLPEESGGFLQVSGLRYTVVVEKSEIAATRVRIENVQVETDKGFVAIDENALYTVGLSSYVAYEGGEITAFRESEIVMDKVMTDSDAMVKFLKSLGDEIPEAYRKPQGRIAVKNSGE